MQVADEIGFVVGEDTILVPVEMGTDPARHRRIDCKVRLGRHRHRIGAAGRDIGARDIEEAFVGCARCDIAFVVKAGKAHARDRIHFKMEERAAVGFRERGAAADTVLGRGGHVVLAHVGLEITGVDEDGVVAGNRGSQAGDDLAVAAGRYRRSRSKRDRVATGSDRSGTGRRRRGRLQARRQGQHVRRRERGRHRIDVAHRDAGRGRRVDETHGRGQRDLDARHGRAGDDVDCVVLALAGATRIRIAGVDGGERVAHHAHAGRARKCIQRNRNGGRRVLAVLSRGIGNAADLDAFIGIEDMVLVPVEEGRDDCRERADDRRLGAQRQVIPGDHGCRHRREVLERKLGVHRRARAVVDGVEFHPRDRLHARMETRVAVRFGEVVTDLQGRRRRHGVAAQ